MPQKRKEQRTYADRKEYLKKAVAERRRKLKLLVIEYKGEKYIICGYDKNTKAEADKCVLVCANCQREIHGDLAQLPQVIEECQRGELSGSPNVISRG